MKGATLTVVEPVRTPSVPRAEAPVSVFTTSDTKETRSTPRRRGIVMSSLSPSWTTMGARVPLHSNTNLVSVPRS